MMLCQRSTLLSPARGAQFYRKRSLRLSGVPILLIRISNSLSNIKSNLFRAVDLDASFASAACSCINSNLFRAVEFEADPRPKQTPGRVTDLRGPRTPRRTKALDGPRIPGGPLSVPRIPGLAKDAHGPMTIKRTADHDGPEISGPRSPWTEHGSMWPRTP